MPLEFNAPAGDNLFDKAKVVGKSTPRIDGPRKTTGTAPMPTSAMTWRRTRPTATSSVRASARGASFRWMPPRTCRARRTGGHHRTGNQAGRQIELEQCAVVRRTRSGPLPPGHRLRGGRDLRAGPRRRGADPHPLRARQGPLRFPGPGTVRAAGKGRDGKPDRQALGDFDTAYASAAVKLDETYHTSDESHSMMEPHATIAAWEGDTLTLWTANQMIDWARQGMAAILGIDPAKVRVDSPYIGGGFGGKLFIRADAVLAALAAKQVGRPVKIALQRPLMPNNTTHRHATLQRVRIGCGKDGRISAIAHENWSGNINGEDGENGTLQTPKLYAGANRLVANYIATLDMPEGNAMRAPGEAPGHMALEVAMDEMAEKLGLDPIAFRILNEPEVVPGDPSKKFSDRNLVRCLREGASASTGTSATPGRRRSGKGTGWSAWACPRAIAAHRR
jgi:xanthine dehydrogenase YagR molybdenum-binding subunit